MSSQMSHKFAFAKMGLLGLCPQLEEDLGDAAVADELAQTFLVALDMVHSAAADAGLDIAVDSEVTTLLSLAHNHLLPHASVAWLEHSPHLVAEREEVLCLSVIAAPPALLDVPGGYTWLTEYQLQVEAGTMSRAEFEAHRSAILMANPGLGLPSSLAVSSPLLRLSMEPPPVGKSSSPAGVLSELFSNQTLQSPALRAATAAPSPSEVAAVLSEVATASVTSGSRSRRPTAEPGPSADLVPPHRVKRGRNFPLMDVAQIPGYIRCLVCIQRKVNAGRECLRPAASRTRGRTGATGPSATGLSATGLSGTAASSSLCLLASAFFGLEVTTLGVALTATVMFWCGEVVRNLAACRALDVQLSFAEWQYAHFLGALVEPDPTTSQPPRNAGNAEVMDDAVDGAGAGADGVDETSWAGFSANFAPWRFDTDTAPSRYDVDAATRYSDTDALAPRQQALRRCDSDTALSHYDSATVPRYYDTDAAPQQHGAVDYEID
ncbi:hypothetical protein EDB89DRAFT_2075085 [Lactarius sanguifluus]|nr:hypothetical protein EDB89DRAFT_2075085 [Lactarius sanguifluus]